MQELYEGIELDENQTEWICRGLLDLASADGLHPSEIELIEGFASAGGRGSASIEKLKEGGFDLEKAKALMEEAGYPDGFDVSILAIAGNADDAALTTALQQMWSAIGVNLVIEPVDSATRTERYRNNDFQMRTAAWTNDINDPSQITSYFAIYDVVESLHTGFQNAELEDLFQQSQAELDPAARADQYARIQEIYVDAAPIVFLYETPYPVALRSNVEGFYQIPLGQNLFVRASITE